MTSDCDHFVDLKGTVSLLLVEDDDGLASALEDVLADHGHDVAR